MSFFLHPNYIICNVYEKYNYILLKLREYIDYSDRDKLNIIKEYLPEHDKSFHNKCLNIFKIISTVSLDEYIENNGDISEENNILDILDRFELRRIIDKVFDDFTEKEKDILFYRYGLDCDHEYTLEELGNLYGVTRERIRQIEGKTIRKLKSPARKNYFEGYLK